MTVEIAVRTQSALVLAADSKLTTSSFVGFNRRKKPQFLTQTYDNAVKIAQDRDGSFIAAVAGNASLGEVSALDFVSKNTGAGNLLTETAQDEYFADLIFQMGKIRYDFWHKLQLSVANWPSTTILVAAISPTTSLPRVWRVEFSEDVGDVMRILETPGVFLEGACLEVFSLLYGYHPEIVKQTKRRRKALEKALSDPSILKPVHQLSVGVMPIQDAMELALFLAGVQIEMDRFLPGTPKCGWPVDLVVLEGTPFRAIRTFPGKELTHPGRVLGR